MLLDILITHHYLTEAQKDQYLAQSEGSVLDFLIDNGFFDSQKLTQILSGIFNTQVHSIYDYEYDAVEFRAFSHLVYEYQMLPLKIDNGTLLLATSDLTQTSAIDDFRFASQHPVQTLLVDHAQLKGAIRKLYGEKLVSSKSGTSVQESELSELADVEDDSFNGDLMSDNAPVSRFIQQVLINAVRKRASDIHFEPFEKTYQIRFRLDGILQVQETPPVGISRRLATRLKILAKLNIAERRLPQDGRIKLPLSDMISVDLRVSTMPTYWGEKIVLRLLNGNNVALDIDVLGYNEKQKHDYLTALHKPQGMILITGPTGSGKTVSMYTGLNLINTKDKNISTAEDPIEITLPDINQVNINPKIGLTFTSALHAMLRQDPDVVMVGEIRDLETAEIGVKAAQTGHLVLSTLHTNSAAESIVRLMNMGIAPYNIASSLSLIMAQRLARRLCPYCKIPHPTDDHNLTLLQQYYAQINTATLFTAAKKGCDRCNQGFNGRIGIYEVMVVTQELTQAISKNSTAIEIERIAIANGMLTLPNAGIEKANEGVTSIDELQRIINFRTN